MRGFLRGVVGLTSRAKMWLMFLIVASVVATNLQSDGSVWFLDCNPNVEECVKFRHLTTSELLRHRICALFYDSTDRTTAFVASIVDWPGAKGSLDSPVLLLGAPHGGYWSESGYVISMVAEYDRSNRKWHHYYFSTNESSAKFALCMGN
jgi:hypothetical protein